MPMTPKNASDDLMARSRAILAQARVAGTPNGLRDDLGRLALVMAVAAIDTYMHTLVMREVSSVRGALPRALCELDVPFASLADMASATVAAQRERRATRPWVAAKHALQERLLRETFQSFDAVASAMAMVGVKKAWSTVADHLGCSADDIKHRLNSIVHRRNKIVHEGDLRRLARPRHVERSAVDLDALEADIDWVDSLLGGIAQLPT